MYKVGARGENARRVCRRTDEWTDRYRRRGVDTAAWLSVTEPNEKTQHLISINRLYVDEAPALRSLHDRITVIYLLLSSVQDHICIA